MRGARRGERLGDPAEGSPLEGSPLKGAGGADAAEGTGPRRGRPLPHLGRPLPEPHLRRVSGRRAGSASLAPRRLHRLGPAPLPLPPLSLTSILLPGPLSFPSP